MTDRIARRLRIGGRVQEGSFRATTRDEAEARGADGWMRQLDVDRVEAHLEGEPAAVTTVIVRCLEGPPAGRVDAVDVAGTTQGLRVARD